MKKNIIYTVVVLAIVGAGIFYLNNYIYQEKQGDSFPDDVANETVIDFDRTGHLVIDNPGLKPGVYYLIYEAPGAPALTVELIFDADSVCEFSGTQSECPGIILVASSLTRVRGTIEEDSVRVKTAVAGE